METITLTDDKTRPNDQAMFPPTKVQQLFEITKLFGKIGRGIHHCTHDALGKKDLFWIKNEVLNNPERYFKTAKYVSSAEVDLTHNKGKVLRLKKKFKQYYYSEITLSNNTKAFLNIILHEDGHYYLYTISKNIATYE